MDAVEYNNKFAVEHNFTYPLICDERGDIVRAFSACKESACTSAARITVVLGRMGKIIRRIAPFDPDKGVNELLEFLSKLKKQQVPGGVI